MHLSPPVALAAVHSKAVALLLLLFHCGLLLPLWDSVIVLCFVMRDFVSFLVLMGKRELVALLFYLPGTLKQNKGYPVYKIYHTIYYVLITLLASQFPTGSPPPPKSRSTITGHQEDKLSKANSSLFPIPSKISMLSKWRPRNKNSLSGMILNVFLVDFLLTISVTSFPFQISPSF